MSFTGTLNQQQEEGVITTEGPVLILAGAGSGKTRVLTHRVAYLLEEKKVAPYHIMAITFTNKAAQEMRQRIDDMVGYGSEQIWVSTFHSACVRILRRWGDAIGYDKNFTIYDSDDQKTLMREVCKTLNIDTKRIKEKTILGVISSAKNELINEQEYAQMAVGNYMKEKYAQAYREYQHRLRQNNALDFDDLIFKTVELLKYQPEVLQFYQEKIQYLMVDEYQDTNTAQFQLIRLLAGGRKNLCVVGDDDQSIYKFRGANIHNILNFEEYYPEAKVIKLEQNYRSTKHILDAANGVIANNKGRKEKSLWTENDSGEKVHFHQFESGYEEAEFVARNILKKVRKGICTYKDIGILYRTNAQSRMLEEQMVREGIPYKIVGGQNFYARKEIKDLISYLKTVDNGKDDLAVQRIINVPKRGIGATTIGKVVEYGLQQQQDFYQCLLQAKEISGLGKAANKILEFTSLIEEAKEVAATQGLMAVLLEIIEQTGYVKELEAEQTVEANSRIENIDELISKISYYEETTEHPTLSGFLEEVALVAETEKEEEESDYLVLMTLHGSKGLEFPHVYLTGMEDGLFPSYNCITAEDQQELEEERRLCYVGITRAKEDLTLTCAQRRMLRGETQYHKISTFVKEIPSQFLQGEIWEPASREEYLAPAWKAKATSFKKAPVMAQTYQNQSKSFGTKIEKQTLDYGVGDRVRHIKFGEGEVLAVVDGGRDYEVTVAFDTAGQKKMFASFAKLQKIR